MSLRRRAQLVLGALILAVPLAGVASPAAYADDSTGSISGHLSTGGQVRTDASVELVNSAGFFEIVGVDFTSGLFQFTDLAPGEYQVGFLYGPAAMQQWYHGKTSQFDADPVTVTAGQDTVVEEQTLPVGTLAGTLTDSAGNPVANADVRAFDNGKTGIASTDADGHYSMDVLPGDLYTLSFQPQQYPIWELRDPGSTDSATFAVTADATTTVDEQLPAVGSMSGRFTDADGQPMANLFVQANMFDGNASTFASTDDNGDYTIPYLFVGQYAVGFSDFNTGFFQYAFGKLNSNDATPITVAANANIVVDDHALATGSITVTAKDAASKKSIADFCAVTDNHEACSNGTGQVVLTGVREGAERVDAYTNDGRYFTPDDQTVTVVAGASVPVAFKMTAGATIDTVVKDAVTGAPVPGVCVVPYSGKSFITTGGFGYCSNDQGVVRIGPISGGSYQLYASPKTAALDTPYGEQWVGAHGGVGLMSKAAVTKVKDGKEVTAPTILLDHAGTITGVITDGATGQPISGAVIQNSASEPGSGDNYRAAVADSTGHYTLTGLGPYAWPLLVTPGAGPWQWTGGVADRTKATTVKVKSDATVPGNVTAAGGVNLTGTVHGKDGTPLLVGRVVAYNAATDEPIGVAELSADGTYRLPLIGSQSVKLRFEAEQEGEADGWYGGADLAHASRVQVPAHHGLNLNLSIG